MKKNREGELKRAQKSIKGYLKNDFLEKYLAKQELLENLHVGESWVLQRRVVHSNTKFKIPSGSQKPDSEAGNSRR